MDAKAWISAASAGISVLACLVSLSSARKSQSIAMGQAETGLRSNIRMTRQAVTDLGLKVGDVINGRRRDQLNAEEKRKLVGLDLAFRAACEDNLNAYEDACAKYIDGKIDKDRFKKTYIEEIKNVCEQKENPYKEFMVPETTSRFKAIWKVYRAWHVHE